MNADTRHNDDRHEIMFAIGPAAEGGGLDWSWSLEGPEGECTDTGNLPLTRPPHECHRDEWCRIAARIRIPDCYRAAIRAAGGRDAARLTITPDRVARFRWSY